MQNLELFLVFFLRNPSVEKKAALVRGEVGEVVDVCDLSSFHRIAPLR